MRGLCRAKNMYNSKTYDSDRKFFFYSKSLNSWFKTTIIEKYFLLQSFLSEGTKLKEKCSAGAHKNGNQELIKERRPVSKYELEHNTSNIYFTWDIWDLEFRLI